MKECGGWMKERWMKEDEGGRKDEEGWKKKKWIKWDRYGKMDD